MKIKFEINTYDRKGIKDAIRFLKVLYELQELAEKKIEQYIERR